MDIKIKKFDSFIKNKLKNDLNIPGIGIIIFDTNKILYKHISGYSNLKTKQKLSFEQKFCIASCSKSILCLSILSLINKKKIPNIFEMTLDKVWSKNIHPEFKKVKVKQLASHNSGIYGPTEPDETPFIKQYSKIEDKLKNLDGMSSRKKLANIILKKKPKYDPGEKFEYSNWAYGILGAIIEKLTKKHYAEIINEEIMIPLNIKADYEKLYYGKKYVNGHYTLLWDNFSKNKLIPLKKNQHINPLYESPSGETWITLEDCAKYCQEFLKALNNKKTILDKSILLESIKRQYDTYAYGWWNTSKNHIAHGGNFFHTTTHFHLVPEKKIGIVLFTNTNILVEEKFSIIKEFLLLSNR